MNNFKVDIRNISTKGTAELANSKKVKSGYATNKQLPDDFGALQNMPISCYIKYTSGYTLIIY